MLWCRSWSDAQPRSISLSMLDGLTHTGSQDLSLNIKVRWDLHCISWISETESYCFNGGRILVVSAIEDTVNPENSDTIATERSIFKLDLLTVNQN